MKNHKLYMFAVLALLASGAAAAGSDEAYAGIAYHAGTYTPSDGDSFSTVGALSIHFGKYATDNLAIEGRLLLGMSSGTKSANFPPLGVVDAEIGIKSGSSLFLKGDLPISNSAHLYALVGYSQLKLELKLSGAVVGSSTNSESGLAYGVGFESTFGSDLAGYVEYLVYPGGTGSADYDYTGVNIGISKRF